MELRRRCLMLCLAAAMLTVTVTGCSSADDVGGTTGHPRSEPAEAGGEWIVGTWTVRHELLTVDPEIMRPAAERDETTWSCTLEGGTLTLKTAKHTYTGPLVVDGDSFSYDAKATYLDEAGEQWTSVIKVDGTHSGETALAAEMWGEISSAEEGVLYTATWRQIGLKTADK
ncbi:MAG: hypothetical protein Q8K99_06645 [Actinomycetota bacterium]|nr:hypothetical protein [Actinomycetota bacterium]